MPKHGSRRRRSSSSSGTSRSNRRGKRRHSSSRSQSRRRRSTRDTSSDHARKSSRRRSKSRSCSGRRRDRESDRRRSHTKDSSRRGRADGRSRGRDRDRARDRARSGKRSQEKGRSSKGSEKSPDKDSEKNFVQDVETRSKKGTAVASGKDSSSPDACPALDGKATTGDEAKPQTRAGVNGKPTPAGLGDLAELQKGLEKERSMLQLFVLKAKQEHEEQKESKDKKERREKEYFRAEFGEPCGPKNQLILEDELGRGVFSTVFRCRDIGVSDKEFAIKFIRSNPMLKKATEKEIRLMRRLRNEASVKDPEGARCFLGLAGPETFEHNGHLALVFHLQRCDMRTGLQKYGQGRGLPLGLVRNYARDIFMALRALRQVNVIHSDLKPDNLLMSLDKASVKLSDFGSAMAVSERVRTDYLQPRFYRAPEVILGQEYSTQIDVWSAGATVFELATGRILFTGKTNNGMIHEMLKMCGAFSKRFATAGDAAAKHFNANGDFRLKEPSGEQLVPAIHFQKPASPISKLLADVAAATPAGIDVPVHQVIVRHVGELIAKCVVPNPVARATPELALAHKFFQKPI
mmetsp:Transcript_67401/g.171077  ORF Transcript_67401/g.171077 Transcript_67401/m.171077 type:complete len:577 (-) Transcript_67401:72-1802(-)